MRFDDLSVGVDHGDRGGVGVGGCGGVFIDAESGGRGARVRMVARVGAVGFARLARGGRGEVIVRWGGGDCAACFVMGEFAEGGAFGLVGAVLGGSDGLAVAGEEFLALACFCRGGGQEEGELFFHDVFEPPFAEYALVNVEPVLLGADYHAGTHEAHEGDNFVGGEAVPVY